MILGLSSAVHNASAALIDNGNVVVAVDEERISRYKRDGRTPIGAINSLLETRSPDSITDIAVSGVVGSPAKREFSYRLRHSTRKNLFTNIGIAVYKTITQPGDFLDDLAGQLATETSIEIDKESIRSKMTYVDHHQAHASGAYFTSGFTEATVVTVDSAGDLQSSTVYHAKNGELTEIAANDMIDSLGRIWSRLPTVFGFKGAKHAGKFMGLAAYADEPPADLRQQFRDMITVDGLNITNSWARKLYRADYETLVRDLRNRVGDYPAPQVARAFQDRTEEILAEFVKAAVDKTGCGNVAVSGGVMANVKANQRIFELPTVDSIWVQQAMSDSGLCIGSAYLVGSRQYNWRPNRLDSLALGPNYDTDTIQNAVQRYQLDNSFSVNNIPDTTELASIAANHLISGDVICLFRGRMEFGPRALGHRSILYQPTDSDAIDWLNKRLNRTEFMPFAPVTLRRKAEECYQGYDPEACPAADHMTISFDCTDEMEERSPGVVHIDGTARPQIIDQQDNTLYYKILNSYYQQTGIPTLINTSFNMHGEPLVCTPQQALESWLQSRNEVLILEDRLITRG